MIAYEKLRELAGYETFDTFQTAHRKWADESLISCENKRESRWAESIAIGSNKFVKKLYRNWVHEQKDAEFLKWGMRFKSVRK